MRAECQQQTGPARRRHAAGSALVSTPILPVDTDQGPGRLLRQPMFRAKLCDLASIRRLQVTQRIKYAVFVLHERSIYLIGLKILEVFSRDRLHIVCHWITINAIARRETDAYRLMIDPPLPAQVLSARQAAGISQADAAQLVGLGDKARWAEYERGARAEWARLQPDDTPPPRMVEMHKDAQAPV